MSDRIIYLRPSTAHAWRRCAGFAKLNAIVRALPEFGDNEVREDGTATHWLSAELWNRGGITDISINDPAPNGRLLTEELVAGAYEWIAFLLTWGSTEHVRVESPLPTGSVFPGTQDGTPDAYYVHPDVPVGELGDLKMGFDPVEVWRNDQLIVYGWTIMCLWPHLTHLRMSIVQPRAAHRHGTIRHWMVSREELRPLAEELQAAARNAHAADPLCTVNRACRNCGGAHACDTLQAAGGAGVETSYDATPHELSAVELGYELTKLEAAAKHIEYRINGLSAQAESIIRAEKRVPGYELGRRATHRRFRENQKAELEQLGRLTGVDVHAPPKLKTPAQLRGAFLGLDIEAMYAERPTGELTLKANDPNEAVRAFTNRKEIPQ